ncbi:MAG: hypothetical protein AAGG75_26455 [Bacteroidota bacterium]
MQNLSSSTTLLFKIVIPTLWITFFGSFTIALLLTKLSNVGPYPIEVFRIGFVIFSIIGIGLLYWALLPLKRVEADGEYFYATNYFKTYRYPHHSVKEIQIRDYLIVRSVRLKLRKAGKFGQKMTFIASRRRFDDFFANHPELAYLLKGDVPDLEPTSTADE